MYKRPLILLAIAGSLGMGYAAWRVAVPAVFFDAQAEAILDEVRDNLESIGAVTADVDCISNQPSRDFVDGAMAAKDEFEFWMDKGTLGITSWRNPVAFNSREPFDIPGEASGLLWDDSVEEAYGAWAAMGGVFDVRVPLGMAEMIPSGLSLDSATHQINGITCNLLASSDFRVFVDAANHHRLIRFEVDLIGSANLAFATDYLQWQTYPGGEYPSVIQTKRFHTDPNYDDVEWNYALSNIQTQATVPDTLFDLFYTPRDTGTLSPPDSPEWEEIED